MNARRLTWLLALLVGVPLLLLGVAAVVAGTEPGTRWLVRVAMPYLPEALELGEIDGSLLGGAELDRLAWRDDGVDAEFRRVEINADLLPLLDRRLRLARLAAASASIEILDNPSTDERSAEPLAVDLPIDIDLVSFRVGPIHVRGTNVDRTTTALHASALLERDRLTLRSLELDSDWLTLSASGDGHLTERLAVDANIAWRFLASADLELRGTLSINGDRRNYRIAHRLTAPVAVATDGGIEIAADSPTVNLTHRWSELERLVDVAGAERLVALNDGVLLTRGNRDALSLDLTTSVLVEERAAALTATGVANTAGLDLTSATMNGDFGRLDVTGRVDWDEALAATLTVALAEFDPSILHAAVPGSVAALANVVVATSGEQTALDVELADLGGELRALPLRGTGRLSAIGSDVAIESLSLQLGASQWSASGTVNDRIELLTSLTVGRLAELDKRVAGTLAVTGRLTGAARAPALNLRAEARGLRYQDNPVGAAVLTLSGTQSKHQVDLSWQGGDADVSAQLRGGLTDDQWSGHLDGLSAQSGLLAGTWRQDAATPLSASAKSATIERLCVRNAATDGQACVNGSYADNEAAANLQIAALPLAALPTSLPVGTSLAGSLHAEAELRYADGALDATATTELVDASLSSPHHDEPFVLRFSDARAGLQVTDNALTSELLVDINDGAGSLRLELNAEDLLSTSAGVSGSGAINVPEASVFAALLPDLSEPTGSLRGQLDVSGSMAAPALTGEIVLADAAFGVRASGIEVHDVGLRLRQDEPGRLRLLGSATSGEGSVAVEGFTELGTESGFRSELTLQGADFELARLPDWRIAASPDIRLLLDDRRAEVTGNLSIPVADITVNSIPESAVQPSVDVTVHSEAAEEVTPARSIHVDVTTTLGESVRLSGYGLKTRIAGDLRIRGSSGDPYAGTGTLSLREGRYKAYGQDLEIETGELVFNGPLENPQLAIRAIRRIDTDDVVAGIDISGTPRQLRSTVFSEPPLGDAEALSYLLTGRPLSRSQEDDSDLLNQAAFALGLSQAGSIASELRSGLGLDTLAVESAGGSGRIVAGKRFGDRLLVEYGYGLVDKLGTLLLRYELNSRLVLESRSGTASELDLVYSVRKR